MTETFRFIQRRKAGAQGPAITIGNLSIGIAMAFNLGWTISCTRQRIRVSNWDGFGKETEERPGWARSAHMVSTPNNS